MISDVSTFQSITCKLEWKLYDLDKHEQFMQNGQYLTSKQFGNPKCPSVKWELRVYPNTYQHNSGIFVSLVQVGLEFTRRVDPHTVKTKFNIYTLDDDGNKNFCCPSTFSVFKYRTESNKYQVFKSQTTTDNLEEGKDYVLVNDSTEALNLDFLLIFCEVEFVPYDIKCENDVVNYSSGVTSQLSLKMFKEGILTDCVIEIGNESINTHRFILAKNSVVFQKMFEQMGMTEALNLVKLIALLFERYNLYNKSIVCSFFPTVVYRIKKENPNILTGITWRRWFITYDDIEFTVPRSSSKLLVFISMILDVIWIWCIKLWIPEFLGVDMVLTERREISPFYLKNMTARGFKVCAWTVNERNEMAWMSRELKIPFLTDAPYIASHVLKNVNAEKN